MEREDGRSFCGVCKSNQRGIGQIRLAVSMEMGQVCLQTEI